MCLNYEYDTINKNYYIPFLPLQLLFWALVSSLSFTYRKKILKYIALYVFFGNIQCFKIMYIL